MGDEVSWRRWLWKWLLHGGVFVIAIFVFAGVKTICTEILSPSIWEVANRVFASELDPAQDVQKRRQELLEATPIRIIPYLVAGGWSLTSLFFLLFIIEWCHQDGKNAVSTQCPQDPVQNLHECLLDFRQLFIAFAAEISKCSPTETKTDWTRERHALQGKVDDYRSIALERLSEIEQAFSRSSQVVSGIRDMTLDTLDKLTLRLDGCSGPRFWDQRARFLEWIAGSCEACRVDFPGRAEVQRLVRSLVAVKSKICPQPSLTIGS